MFVITGDGIQGYSHQPKIVKKDVKHNNDEITDNNNK